MKVFVTGGAGYVGSVLTSHLLESGHEVLAFDSLRLGGEGMLGHWSHPNFRFVKGDLRDRVATKSALQGAAAVVHLAGIVGDPACAKEPEVARDVNLTSAVALLEAARDTGVSRFVFASTCSNYGKMKDPSAYVDEESELTPVSLYARTKVEFEQALMSLPGSMCTTALRNATVFGVSPRMRFDLTVNEFTRDLLLTKKLKVYGPEYWRPYVHLRDLARAVTRVLEADASRVDKQVFNVGSTSENFRKIDLVKMIQEHVPESEVEIVQVAEDPRDYRVSFAKIERVLDFKARWTVQQGIAEVADLVRSAALFEPMSPKYRNV